MREGLWVAAIQEWISPPKEVNFAGTYPVVLVAPWGCGEIEITYKRCPEHAKQ